MHLYYCSNIYLIRRHVMKYYHYNLSAQDYIRQDKVILCPNQLPFDLYKTQFTEYKQFILVFTFRFFYVPTLGRFNKTNTGSSIKVDI